ncbi:MAG: PQQ-binding-like beta-propeller repeat protein [Gammaproteobacteria bacterium]|nr:PQQ-binding-like beta-propeller repeat protein [Gammaproteobacteria bacterium]MYF31240.1 PQQ-binding-like beta-propeller repeat protein [Gammaproteobacteria bacterium]MYK48413.1 PQQ-binding-like beta-propeller repeat protein [Gammaproteobacteria bacterium]
MLSAGKGFSGETAEGWPHYGGSLGGDRYVAPSGITPESVERLARAWVYRTGDATDGRGEPSKFRATPILVGGKLIASTGFNRVFAVDAATGTELWTFDPKVDRPDRFSEPFTSRGVSAWQGAAADTGPCRARVFLGTLDARLFALDADTGVPCADFGEDGVVDLSAGIPRYYKHDYSVTSPTTVVGDLVIVGSAVGDNGAADLAPGVVRAFDVRDGSLVWAWDPVPRSEDHPGADSWAKVRDNRTGGANVWSVMSADPARDLVFLPTTWGSMAFDHGSRIGYLGVARLPTLVKLIPREQFRAAAREGRLNGKSAQHTAQDGTPYGMARTELVHNDLPCLEDAWSTLVAVDLDEGKVLWERPVGIYRSGGPMVTEGGVVFLPTTSDRKIRAFHGVDGNELWSAALPAGVHSTPMGYRHDGTDYVVVTAGGSLAAGRGRGDYVIAFRLETDAASDASL